MKLKSLLLLSFVIITFNTYSQENIIKRENILIIAELTSDYFNQIEDVFPKDYVLQKEYFKYSQIRPEIVISPEKNISCIVETPIKYETKFGKIEKTELQDYETKYFYNENGFLFKIIQENGVSSNQNYNKQNKVFENTIEISIGNYGELISKQNSYENNSNGISKIIRYNENGDVNIRFEIFYNNKGQIIKYDTFERNNIQKEKTKTFEYDTNGNLIKSSLVENYENELKTIPRRNITYSYTNNLIISKSSWNDFAEGTNSISDFSKIGGVTLNDFINKRKLKITISDKTIQEIKKGIIQKWKNSVVDYEYLFKAEPKINNWDEKKIFNKLYKQITEKEQIYSIKRKYINKEQLNSQNNLTKTREQIITFIEGIYSDETLKSDENIKKFASLNVELDKFCFWIDAGGEYIFPQNINFTKEMVLEYKNLSYKLADNLKIKITNENLKEEELSKILVNEEEQFNLIVNRILDKITIRKRFVALVNKNREVQRVYDLLYPTTYKPDKKYDLYQEKKERIYKNEDLYFIYLDLFKSITKEDILDDNISSEMLEVQKKMIQLVNENTNKLEKVISKETENRKIIKAILDYKIE